MARQALRKCHELGIVHRDVKPPNLIYSAPPSDEGSLLKLVDFGLAARHSPGAFCNGMGEPVPDELLPPVMRDDELAARLWEVTERLVQQYEEHAKAAA